MSGFPNKITRSDIGPTFEDEVKITNPKRELGANAVNLMAWQVAGMNGPAARGLVVATLVGTVVTVQQQWFAWDPNQALPKMAFTRTSVGAFSWSLPDGGLGVGVYPDKDGQSTSVQLFAAILALQGSSPLGAIGLVAAGGKTGNVYTYLIVDATAADPQTFLVWFI